MYHKYTKEMLEDAVAHSNSYYDVVRFFGLKLNGGTSAYLKLKTVEFGIDVSHFYEKIKNGKMPYSHNRKTAKQFLVKSNHKQHGLLLFRSLLEIGRSGNCEICGLKPVWYGKALRMQVDHIDGDNTNNVVDNLRIVCPNCHTQTDNYCMSGRGKPKKICSICNHFIGRDNKTGLCISCYLRDGHKRKEEKNNRLCVCGQRVSLKSKSGLCKRCVVIGRERKVERPSKSVLLEQTKQYGFCRTGRIYGVSDNAIRKWLRHYDREKLVLCGRTRMEQRASLRDAGESLRVRLPPPVPDVV